MYLSNGTYLKLNDRTDRLTHSLKTSQFWGHLVDGRADQITAAFTRDDQTSFVFYDDGSCSEYLNLPDLGIGSYSTTVILEGDSQVTSIVAATDWPDDGYYVFQRDGAPSR